MVKINRETFFSPPGLFACYILFAALAIMGFRLIFPGEAPPLACFSLAWRFLRGAEDFITVFPALALSALVFPFGVSVNPREYLSSFSPQFLKTIGPSIVIAVTAAGIYGFFFLLGLPLVMNHSTDLRAQARLYNISAREARIHAGEKNWAEAARFLTVAERIWPGSPELVKVLEDTAIGLDEISHTPGALPENDLFTRQDLTKAAPVSAAEAMEKANTAMREERYFDAHWLATLAGDLVSPESAEFAAAAALAGQAWNNVSSMEPNSRESEAFRLYHLKQDAYRALVSNNWIDAYYLFREFLLWSPDDPDGRYYLELSSQGVSRMAFFVDEMELRENPGGALFSLPKTLEKNRALEETLAAENGRLILRFASLSVFSDSAYGMGLEVLSFDRAGKLLWQLETPYAKILPLSPDSGPRIIVLTQALDRQDKNQRWEPQATSFGESAPTENQLSLNIGWKEFTLLSEIRRSRYSLSPGELFAISRLGSGYGYPTPIFEAELLCRFAEPVFFLPFLILTLALGWRFRARKKVRVMWLPMLVILPVVFNGVFLFYRNCLGNLTLWTLLGFGFSGAIAVFAGGAVVLFLLSLIILASRHD